MYIYSRQNIPLRNIFTSPFPYLHKEDCLQPLLFQGSTHHKEGRFLSTRLRTRFGQLLSRFSSFRFTVTRNVFHQRFENVSPRSQPVTAEERSQACFRDKRKTGDCSNVHKHAYTHARTHARAWRAFLRKTGAIYGQTENSSQYSTSGFFLHRPWPSNALLLERRSFGIDKETMIYAGQLKSGELLSREWTYWQGMVDNAFMLILSAVSPSWNLFFQEREIGILGGKHFKNSSNLFRNTGTIRETILP